MSDFRFFLSLRVEFMAFVRRQQRRRRGASKAEMQKIVSIFSRFFRWP
jgi:hypothetical protein